VIISDTKSHKIKREHKNFSAMKHLASKMAKSTVPEFQYGKSVDLNKYTADGTVFDYMAGKQQVNSCL